MIFIERDATHRLREMTPSRPRASSTTPTIDLHSEHYMALSKREIAGIERQLVAALTEACETAKAEIPGFE